MSNIEHQLIFLVEDDLRLSNLVSQYLEQNGFKIQIAHLDGNVIQQIERAKPDLVILDLGLPKEDGLTICRRLRPHNAVPVLILTARDNDVDHVLGLELGADDYVVKPVKPPILLARVNALLRRRQPPAYGTPDSRTLRFGALAIDGVARTVTLNGRSIPLSSSEFDLLAYLAARAGEIQSREVIYKALLGREYDGLERVLDIRISHLRKKLEDEPGARIKTIWGRGYLFVPTAW